MLYILLRPSVESSLQKNLQDILEIFFIFFLNAYNLYLRQRNFHFAEKENVNGVSISCFAIPRKSINRIKEKYFQKSNNLQLL